MRPIKFRAKDKSGEWLYGYLCELHEFEKGKQTKKLAIQCENGRIYPILPETVGRCVGFLDKNGKEICEGDILRVVLLDSGCYLVGVVRRSQCFVPRASFGDATGEESYEWWYIELINTNDPSLKGRSSIPVANLNFKNANLSLKNTEVIGNIYDNPELLEKEAGR